MLFHPFWWKWLSGECSPFVRGFKREEHTRDRRIFRKISHEPLHMGINEDIHTVWVCPAIHESWNFVQFSSLCELLKRFPHAHVLSTPLHSSFFFKNALFKLKPNKGFTRDCHIHSNLRIPSSAKEHIRFVFRCWPSNDDQGALLTHLVCRPLLEQKEKNKRH